MQKPPQQFLKAFQSNFMCVCVYFGREGDLEITFFWSKPEHSIQWLAGNFTFTPEAQRWLIPKSQLFQCADGCTTDCYQPSWAAPASSSTAQMLEHFQELCLHRKYLCLPTQAALRAPEQWDRKGDKRISWVFFARLSNKKNQTVKLI